MSKHSYALVLVCGSILAIYGCNSFAQASWWLAQSPPPMTIASLRDPNRADPTPETVTVQGQITRKVPLLEQVAYELQDQTGTIMILTRQGTDPQWTVGATVTAQGRLRTETMVLGKEQQRYSDQFIDMDPETATPAVTPQP